MVAVGLPLLALVSLVSLWTPGQCVVYPDTLDVCFFCDLACVNVLNHYYGDDGVDHFISQTMDGVAAELRTLHPYIDARKHLVVTMGMDLQLAWFNGNDRTPEALATANMGLWGELTGMYHDAREEGCDAGFAMFDSDNAFLYSGIEGIANTFQACSDLSFSIIKLYPQDYSHQVALVAHEMGHLVGLYHDGPMNPVYEALRPLYPLGVNHLETTCASEGSGCADPSGYCIMSAVSGAGDGYATQFSNCSIEYFRMFREIARDFPMIYDASCFMGEDYIGRPRS